MNLLAQPTMIARCAVLQRITSPWSPEPVPWTPCGTFPATLDPDGAHMCWRHFTMIWVCQACKSVEQDLDAMTWVQDLDGSLCSICYADWNDPEAHRAREEAFAAWCRSVSEDGRWTPPTEEEHTW
jgi:hypothetical protein